MTKIVDWRVISEKAEGQNTDSGQATIDTSNLDTNKTSLTANGITLNDLEEISNALAGSAKDLKKLRSVAKHVNKGNSLTKESLSHSLLEGSANNLKHSDLEWALSSTESKEDKKNEDPEKKTHLSNEDKSFFQNLVKSVNYTDKSIYLENGKAAIAEMDNFSSEDWKRIRASIDKADDSSMHLPEVSILCEIEHQCENTSDRSTEDSQNSASPAEAISIKRTEEGITTVDKIEGIKTTTKDGVTTSQLEGDVAVTRDSTTGTTSYEVRGEKLYEQSDNGTRKITLDNGANVEIATTTDGAEIIKDGKVIANVLREYTWQECDEGIFTSVRNANTPEEALEILKSHRSLDGIEKDLILARTGGASLVRDGRIVADFEHNDKGALLEARFYVTESKQLVRTGDGKLLIREPNKPDVALNDEQLEFIIQNLGENAKFIAGALRALKAGRSLNLGNDVSIDVSRDISGQIGARRQGTRKPFRFKIFGDRIESEDPTGTQLKRNNTTGNTTVVSESGKTAEIRPTDKDFDVKTEELELKDGRVTFADSKVVINKDGSYILPNGTTVDTDSSVTLFDGTKISADGRITRDTSSNVSLELNQPSQKSLEVYNSFAKSIASSVASRVKGGAVSLSDIALLRANLSILTNYIGFFTKIGNLDVVNTLNSSRALVQASLDEAEPTVKRKQQLSDYVYKRANR